MASINTAHQNYTADNGINFSGGTAEVRTGAKPANANLAKTGILLGTVALPTPALGAAVAGVRSKAGVWSTNGIADSEAGHVVLEAGGRRMDLNVGAEVTMADTTVVNGAPLVITAVTIAVPAGV
jgi:hypothetical protein